MISVYEDIGISGVKSRTDRPALDQMLRDAKAGKFDKVVCFDISRLGRSMANLISTLQDLEQAGEIDNKKLFKQRSLKKIREKFRKKPSFKSINDLMFYVEKTRPRI